VRGGGRVGAAPRFSTPGAKATDFSRFDPASPGDGPTLATLVRPRPGADFSNFARGVDRRPFCGGARRCGVGAAPHFSTPGAKATDF
jgi:hypothetical protein